jgi:hypothetical protein
MEPRVNAATIASSFTKASDDTIAGQLLTFSSTPGDFVWPAAKVRALAEPTFPGNIGWHRPWHQRSSMVIFAKGPTKRAFAAGG